MEDNKKIPESNEASAEKTEAGAKKPLPKSTIIVGAISAVIIIALTVALILSLGSKKPDGGSGNSQNNTAPTVTVDENGFVIVNGTKTEHKVYTEPVISEIDGYVAINGEKTKYPVFCYHEWETVTTEPTCKAGGFDTATCKLCGRSEVSNETPKLDHSFKTTYSFDDNYHWYGCSGCSATSGKALHADDGNGECSVCNVPISATPGVVYDVSADGTYAEVLAYGGTAKKVKIASEYNGLPVKTVYSKAFKGNKTITSVIIPDSVTSIGDEAFSWCSSLESVVIPDSVTSISDHAFSFCDSLESVVIGDSVTSIGDEAFHYCSSLKSVVIPDSVTSIGEGAFSWCDLLESVVIGDSVTSIGGSAFSNCSSALYTKYEYGKYVKSGDNPYAVLIAVTNKNFSTYTIHEDTKIIAYEAFNGCSRLTNITIPDSVTSIGSSAFSWCDSFESVVIPDSVTSIGDDAFFLCDSLRDVYYTGTEEEWGQISIGDNYDLTSATIHYNYVPEE